MAFRSDLGAAHARADALEGKVGKLEAENAQLREELASEDAHAIPGKELVPAADEPGTELQRFGGPTAGVVAASAVLSTTLAIAFYGAQTPLLLVGALSLLSLTSLIVARQLLHRCPPGFMLVLSGQTHQQADGSTAGFRIVTEGRVLRMPFLEKVDLLDCRSQAIECSLTKVYCKGGAALAIGATASYRLGAHEPLASNAIQRFLGRGLSEVDQVAKETLEGQLRAVVASTTIEELKTERQRVAQRVCLASEEDMGKLGIVLETLALGEISEILVPTA